MAWWVVFGHALQLSGIKYIADVAGEELNLVFKLINRGETAVNVFIIISGFVITHLLLAKKEKYLPYITRRWFRIFPIFLFCFLLALAIKPLYLIAYTDFVWVNSSEMRIERAYLEEEYFWSHILLHFTMLHGLVPEEVLKYASSSILVPAWSLSLEWQFYIIAPFVMILIAKKNVFTVSFILFCLITFYLLNEYSLYSWKYNSFLLLAMPHFIIGIVSRMLIEGYDSKRFFWGALLLVSCFLGDKLAVLIWLIFFPILLSEAKLLSLPDFSGPIIRVLFFNRVIQNLGKWSYSTYLVHIPIFSVFVGGVAYFKENQLTQPDFIFLISCASIATIPISWFLYNYIEKPFIKIGAKVSIKINSQ